MKSQVLDNLAGSVILPVMYERRAVAAVAFQLQSSTSPDQSPDR